MSTIVLDTDKPQDPNYWTLVGRVSSGSSWPSIRDGVATWGSTTQSGGPHVRSTSSTTTFYSCNAVDIVYDLRDYQLLKITSATIKFDCYKTLFDAGQPLFFNTDARNGVAVCGQRESTRTSKSASTSTYVEVHAGAKSGLEYCNRVGWNSIPNSPGATVTWTFNSAGLAYLNSIHNKTYFPGYAFMGLCWGGIVDGVTPIAPYAYQYQNIAVKNPGYDTNPFILTLTYTAASTSVSMNVGDVQKAIGSAKINVGNSWKTVSEIKVNVGDVWKNVVV